MCLKHTQFYDACVLHVYMMFDIYCQTIWNLIIIAYLFWLPLFSSSFWFVYLFLCNVIFMIGQCGRDWRVSDRAQKKIYRRKLNSIIKQESGFCRIRWFLRISVQQINIIVISIGFNVITDWIFSFFIDRSTENIPLHWYEKHSKWIKREKALKKTGKRRSRGQNISYKYIFNGWI